MGTAVWGGAGGWWGRGAGGVLAVGGGSGRRFWITATAREGLQCCGGGVEGTGRRLEVPMGSGGV